MVLMFINRRGKQLKNLQRIFPLSSIVMAAVCFIYNKKLQATLVVFLHLVGLKFYRGIALPEDMTIHC